MFGTILKELRTQEGLSQDDLAKILGISKSTIGMYEQGKRSPHSDEILKGIASHFEVSIDYLKGYSPKNTSIISDFQKFNFAELKTKAIPLLGKVACGKPIMCEQEYEATVPATGDFLADFCLIAEGDSMINARIFDGDTVFIREQSIVENGEIAVVIVNDDEVTLKRFYYYPDIERVVLQAENPKYQPMVFEKEDLQHIRILGKAVAFTSYHI